MNVQEDWCLKNQGLVNGQALALRALLLLANHINREATIEERGRQLRLHFLVGRRSGFQETRGSVIVHDLQS